MGVLITGGCGFLAQRIAKHILASGLQATGDSKDQRLVLLDIALPSGAERLQGAEYVAGDINDQDLLVKVVTTEIHSIFHLAAVLSGGAEANYPLGIKVNIQGTAALLDRCRVLGHRPRLVFASSVAVFGGTGASLEQCTEDTSPTPQSSYGTQKVVCELLIADASRRGFVDGRCVRLPTVAVRPGRPNSAASSFCSSIIREPLRGEAAVCPVKPDLPLWLQSPRLAVQNLLHAHSAALPPGVCVVTGPGITTTPLEMVEALVQAGGDKALVRWKVDPAVDAILSSWPGYIHTPAARAWGFQSDRDVHSIVRAYIEDEGGTK